MTTLRAPTAKPVTLTAIHPSPAVKSWYRSRLDSLIAEMTNSTLYWIRATWRKDPPVIAQDGFAPGYVPPVMAEDASPIVEMRRTMRLLARRWQSKFDAAADEIARMFADKSKRATDAAMMATLREAGFALTFKPSAALNNGMKAIVHENVALIRSIPAEYLRKVEQDVWQSIRKGYDLGTLTAKLQTDYRVATFNRAALIARDQTAKAKGVIEAKRRQQLGITEAIWQHSGGGKEPRPDHVEAGRKQLRFKLDKGAYISGEYIFPGELINCRCTSRGVIPGIDN